MNADLPLSKTSLSKLDGVSSRAAWVEVSARRRAVERMVLMCGGRRAPDLCDTLVAPCWRPDEMQLLAYKRAH